MRISIAMQIIIIKQYQNKSTHEDKSKMVIRIKVKVMLNKK